MKFPITNLNLYKAFSAVYETQNMSRAAELMGTTQPNITHNIKELERQLGIKLFFSSPRGVRPTKEADELYTHVSSALIAINNAENVIQDFSSASSGVIRIVHTSNFVGHLLGEYISRFNQDYPNIEFDISYRRPGEAISVLEKHNVDLIFSTLPIETEKDFASIAIKQMPEVFFASSDFAAKHNLQPTVTKAKLGELPLISIRGFNHIGKKPSFTVDSQEMLFQLVNKGLGVGHCLEEFLTRSHPNASLLKFNVQGLALAKWTLKCVYHKDFTPKQVKAFLDKIKATPDN